MRAYEFIEETYVPPTSIHDYEKGVGVFDIIAGIKPSVIAEILELRQDILKSSDNYKKSPLVSLGKEGKKEIIYLINRYKNNNEIMNSQLGFVIDEIHNWISSFS